jgi:hypothetical protein
MEKKAKQKSARRTLALAALVMASGTAGAVPLTFEGVPGGSSDYISVNIPANSGTGFAGYSLSSLDVYVGFASYQIGTGPVTDTFCVDFYNDSIQASEPYSPISLASGPQASAYVNVAMGSAAAATIEKLWAMNYSTAVANARNGNYSTSAELQEAIWMTEALAAGGTFSGSTYESAALTMYDAAGNYNGPLTPLFDYSNPLYQDYIGVGADSGDPVPDSGATVVLLGLSFPGLVLIRRKFFRA